MPRQLMPAEEFETKKRSNWFTWWRIDPEELQRQVSQYDTLKLYQSARGLSVLFLLLSATITAILTGIKLSGFDDINYVDAAISVFLAIFILLGHRWAMLVAMVFWTIEKGNQIFTVFDSSRPQPFNVIIAVVWWAVYMHAFYLAFRTEQARRACRADAAQDAIALEPQAPIGKPGLILRLWNGDVSLAKTYWLYGVLGGVIFRLLSPWLTYLLASNVDNLSRFDEAIIRYAWSALLIFYSVLISIAIWRSATKSIKRNPKSSAWAYLAKVSVIFGVIAGVAGIAASFSPTAIQELHEFKNRG